MPPTARVLIGLLVGLGLGILAAAARLTPLLTLVDLFRPLGALWVNAILMTVVPLVVASLVVSLASVADSRVVGTLGWRAITVLSTLLFAGGMASALLTPAIVKWLPNDVGTVTALRAAMGAGPSAALPVPASLAQWVGSLMPSNVVRAAADGAMLPLVVFSLVFALALARVDAEPRRLALGFFEAVGQAMLVVLGWVIRAAPIGVFALALSLGSQVGVTAAGVIATYVMLSVALCLGTTAALYAVAVIGGGIPLRRFAQAAAPSQAVGASTRSSLAALPAMLQAAESELGLPPMVGGVFLPFAVATFKFTSPVAYIGAACFLAHALGVELGTLRLVSLIPLAVAMSLGVPGVPGGWFTATPVFVAAGLPPESIGILIAVDTIPDIFRTLGNVTADLAAATVVARLVPRPTQPLPLGAPY